MRRYDDAVPLSDTRGGVLGLGSSVLLVQVWDSRVLLHCHLRLWRDLGFVKATNHSYCCRCCSWFPLLLVAALIRVVVGGVRTNVVQAVYSTSVLKSSVTTGALTSKWT